MTNFFIEIELVQTDSTAQFAFGIQNRASTINVFPGHELYSIGLNLHSGQLCFGYVI